MFRVGDRVFNLEYGWGIVKKIGTGRYAVLVEFKGGELYFSIDGKESIRHNRTLFFAEIPIPQETLVRPKYRAKRNGWYFYVGSMGQIVCGTELGDDVDKVRYEVGNYSETEEEAKNSKFYKVFHEEE